MVFLALEIFTRRVFYPHNLKIRLMLAKVSLFFVFSLALLFLADFFPSHVRKNQICQEKKKPMRLIANDLA